MSGINRSKVYRITGPMLDAGVATMEQCVRLGEHTPRTTCHAVFTAMLNAADSMPGTSLSKSFAYAPSDTLGEEVHGNRVYRGVFLNRPPLERSLDTYAGMELGAYKWQGYFWRYRKHCFKAADSDWIWLYESDWRRSDFATRLAAGAFRANSVFCWQNLKSMQITRS